MFIINNISLHIGL